MIRYRLFAARHGRFVGARPVEPALPREAMEHRPIDRVELAPCRLVLVVANED